MGNRTSSTAPMLLVLALGCLASASERIEIARHEQEYSNVRVEPARAGQTPGIAVLFEGSADLHYYADPESAPAEGFELKVRAESDTFEFGAARMPRPEPFTDSVGQRVKVFSSSFVVFVPITSAKADTGEIRVTISGIACTSLMCLPPFRKELQTTLDWTTRDTWKQVEVERQPVEHAGPGPSSGVPNYSTWFALVLAFCAGVILNIMPCVLPVIPLKVLSIFEQAKQSRARCVTLGLSFCTGIMLFFALIAGANIVLRLAYGTVLQWGDHFRNPVFLMGMSILLVALATFMFGAFTITVPSSIAGKAGPRKGHAGSVAMGLLAAVLSTPCSFAILTSAFGWAQTQGIVVATAAILLIGAGMAAPYLLLTSMPGLVKRVPRAGRWSELFKQSLGFVLLIVAVWLMLALPENRIAGTAYFAAILAFCLWMWGGWVNLMTPRKRKLVIRSIALAIAVLAGYYLLPARASRIDWQRYDRSTIEKAVREQRPVLIEFMAEWCVNCRAVEKFVYSKRSIAGLIAEKGVLAVRADTSRDDYPATADLKNVYGEPGVPVTILLVPGRAEPQRFHGVFIGTALKEALKALPNEAASD